MANTSPELGGGAAAVLGPRPLLRYREGAEGRGSGGHLELQQEGLELLRRAGSPLHVAFVVGGSRCGKSTAGNSLLFPADDLHGSSNGLGDLVPGGGAGGFETGSSFDPVTTGVDVAVRLLPGGGALIVGDCEGAFHLAGSSGSARGFGVLGAIAYHMSSVFLHVSMGSIDERDIEVLGHLAASVRPQPGLLGVDEESRSSAAPGLILLVNGARFDLGDAVARRLLRLPDGAAGDLGARGCSRAAIASSFCGQPALEALPSCEHAAYWPKVAALRRRILDAPPITSPGGSQASGMDLAQRLINLVSRLNGQASPTARAVPGSVQPLRPMEPEPATEAYYRSTHLEPLIEEIARRFAREGAEASAGPASTTVEGEVSEAAPRSPPRRAAEEALREFDRRTAWLCEHVGAGAGGTGRAGGSDASVSLDGSLCETDAGGSAEALAAVRPGLVAQMRRRLESRLEGNIEALARGRQQGAAARRPRSGLAGRDRPASLAGSRDLKGACVDRGKECTDTTPPVTPSTAVPSCVTTPHTAQSAGSSAAAGSSRRASSTPGTARRLCGLEEALEEVQSRLMAGQQRLSEDVAASKASFEGARDDASSWLRGAREADRKVASDSVELQGKLKARLCEIADARVRSASSQATVANESLTRLGNELRSVEEMLPDMICCTSELDQIRGGLETVRLARREAAEASSRAVEARLKGLRQEVDQEVAALDAMRDGFGRRFARCAAELRGSLEDERHDRQQRHAALTEVVSRMRLSLEASVDEAIDPLPPISPPSTLASGLNGLLAARRRAQPPAAARGRRAAAALAAGASSSWRAAAAPPPPPPAMAVLAGEALASPLEESFRSGGRDEPRAALPGPPQRLPPTWGWQAVRTSDSGEDYDDDDGNSSSRTISPGDRTIFPTELDANRAGLGGHRSRVALAASAVQWAK
mmetsp:Transcript_170142/g.545616  ORF Transcript_170142/g.545616 Transcript_170142/m.545616 type:complete len:934 (+) Transcript_170142:84-2885(+)